MSQNRSSLHSKTRKEGKHGPKALPRVAGTRASVRLVGCQERQRKEAKAHLRHLCDNAGTSVLRQPRCYEKNRMRVPWLLKFWER